MKRALGVVVLVGILLVAGISSPAAADGSFGRDPAQVGGLNSDLVIIQSTVSDTGTAAFQIQYAIELADENDSRAFDDLAADIESNQSAYLNRFSDRMNATVDAAERATGRQMTIGDFGVTTNRTSIGKEYGLVTYSATWTGFANASGDQMQVGDALAGLFIDQDTRFVLRWSEEYHLESVSPSPSESTDGKVSWAGPREFESGEPSVILVPAVETTAPPSTTQAPPGDTNGLPWTLIGVGIAAILVIVGFWYRQNRAAGTDDGSTNGDGPGQAGAATTDPTDPSPDLLSNEERVQRYLESEGGRAKQQEIVDALDWTEAKTSQVLSNMNEAGTIEKFRIGRENVVKIPDDQAESE